MKKAQTWSLDVMVGILIFITIFITFFYILNRDSDDKGTEKLKEEAELIANKLISSDEEDNESIVENKIVNNEKVIEFFEKSDKSYENLKREFGIEGDFYIHFEDFEGNIICINETDVGIGSKEVEVEYY